MCDMADTTFRDLVDIFTLDTAFLVLAGGAAFFADIVIFGGFHYSGNEAVRPGSSISNNRMS